jgi:ABC-type oligopeptide transport system substrate-binding subunit
MKRLYVALCVTLVTLSAANAESVLRTMVTTDIRGLMPGNSPDENNGLVLQNIFEGLIAWRSDGAVAPMPSDFLALAGGLRVKVGTAALEVQSTYSSRPERSRRLR